MRFESCISAIVAYLLIAPPATASTTAAEENIKLLKGHISVKGPLPSLTAICEGDGDEAVITGNPEFDLEMVNRLNKKGLVSAIEPSLNRFVLYKGRMLIACSKRINLLLANADLDIAPNSMVYVADNGFGTCAIVNLHDEHLNDVKVHVGKETVSLQAGRQLILTSNTDAGFKDVNLCWGLGFRRMAVFMPVPTIKAFHTQYSLLSAVYMLPAVRKLARSNTKEGYKVLKTGAAVYAASGYPRDFQ